MAESRLRRDKLVPTKAGCQPCHAGGLPRGTRGVVPKPSMTVDVYINFSPALQKHYIGLSNSADKRLHQHRSAKRGWTRRADDWKEIWRTSCASYDSARELEKRIKRRGAALFLRDQ